MKKTTATLGWTAAIIISLAMLLSVVAKLTATHESEIGQMFVRENIWTWRFHLAALETIIVVFFLIPRTSTVGLIFNVGYWGGAMATVISHNDFQPLYLHAVMFALLIVTAFCRNTETVARLMSWRYPSSTDAAADENTRSRAPLSEIAKITRLAVIFGIALLAVLNINAQNDDTAKRRKTNISEIKRTGKKLEANKTVVRRFYEPFNGGSVTVFDDILTIDWIEHPPAAPNQKPGREEYKKVIGGIRQILPDLKIEIQDIIAEGDKVVVRSILSATPQTEFMGVKPNGKSFSIMTIDIHRLANGRIAETWHVEDFTDALRQLGGAAKEASNRPN